MTEEELKAEIERQLDGIKVQWQDIDRQSDPKVAQQKRDGVFATMDAVGDLMRKYWSILDDAHGT